MSENILFHCKCEASVIHFKHLFDMLMQAAPLSDKNPSLREAFFKITNENMKIYTNLDYSMCIISEFKSNYFSLYEIFHNELSIGISLDYIKQFFKNVKKSDAISFKIIGDQYNIPLKMKLEKIQNKGLSLVNEITVHMVQSEYLCNLGEYTTPNVVIPNNIFLSVCRSLNLHPGYVCVELYDEGVATFSFDINEITSNIISVCSDGVVKKCIEGKQPVFKQIFNANCLKNSSKLSNIFQEIKIYGSHSNPLLLEANNSSCTIQIWIKHCQTAE